MAMRKLCFKISIDLEVFDCRISYDFESQEPKSMGEISDEEIENFKHEASNSIEAADQEHIKEVIIQDSKKVLYELSISGLSFKGILRLLQASYYKKEYEYCVSMTLSEELYYSFATKLARLLAQAEDKVKSYVCLISALPCIHEIISLSLKIDIRPKKLKDVPMPTDIPVTDELNIPSDVAKCIDKEKTRLALPSSEALYVHKAILFDVSSQSVVSHKINQPPQDMQMASQNDLVKTHAESLLLQSLRISQVLRNLPDRKKRRGKLELFVVKIERGRDILSQSRPCLHCAKQIVSLAPSKNIAKVHWSDPGVKGGVVSMSIDAFEATLDEQDRLQQESWYFKPSRRT